MRGLTKGQTALIKGDKLFTKPGRLGCANAICDECDSANGWIDWSGGKCPVKPDAKVRYQMRGGATGLDRAGELYWGTNGVSQGDIVRYRVVDAAPKTEPIHAALDTLKTSTNPKDAVGSVKLPLHLWPAEATAMGCLGMLEGMLKYGRNNYIAGDGVIASIYVDAAKRHLDAWFSCEENSPDSGVPHLANALATIAIIVKAQANDKLIDDRDYAPIKGYRKLVDSITPHVKRLQALFADKKPKHYTIADNPKED